MAWNAASVPICPRLALTGRVRVPISNLLEVIMSTPKPFEVHESGAFFHGTKADLVVGDLLVFGRRSNYGGGRTANHIYLTATLDAATWGAELAVGEGRGRIYIVEPTGMIEDDPNVTDKRFPGNPTRSYRTREPVKIVGELADWEGHSADQLQAMRDGLADLERQGLMVIDD
jgi:rifampin ADP-ribosylating transferase